MYLIIIEGTDNIGKDTLVSRLIEEFDTVTLIHCHGPKATIFKNKEQDRQFIQYAENIINNVYSASDCIIMNRSHYGEYVYGHIYRHRSLVEILNMINLVDKMLMSQANLTIKYIQLVSSDIDLRITNDDNKSLSDKDREKMLLENKLFNDIFVHSPLDKEMIYVNNGSEFRSKDEIFNDVIKFIEK